MQEWHLENSQFEVLEKQNGDCLVKINEIIDFILKMSYLLQKNMNLIVRVLYAGAGKIVLFC